jgi:hypothetical protein
LAYIAVGGVVIYALAVHGGSARAA